MSAIQARYDKFADVLYVTTGRNAPAKSKVDADGLIWRYATPGGEPVGVTITDFRAFWVGHIPEIAASMGRMFHIPDREVADVLESAS